MNNSSIRNAGRATPSLVYIHFVCAAIVGVLPNTSAIGQSNSSQVTIQTEPIIPKREFEVSRRTAPYTIPLKAFDSQDRDAVRKFTYVGIIKFSRIPRSHNLAQSFTRSHPAWSLPKSIVSLYDEALPVLVQNQSTPAAPRSRFSRLPLAHATSFRDATPLLKALAKHAPPKHLPSEETLTSLFTHGRVFISRCVAQDSRLMQSASVSILVFADNSQEAASLCRGVVQLYDYGLSYVVQQQLIPQLVPLHEAIGQAERKIEQAREKIKELKQVLDRSDLWRDESRAELRARAREIAVDMAAAKARIAECNRMLSRDDIKAHPVGRQVESLKVTAEIELVGLAAKHDVTARLIAKSDAEYEVRLEFDRLKQSLESTLLKGPQWRTRQLGHFGTIIRSYQPFPVSDSQIPIHPVQWIVSP